MSFKRAVSTFNNRVNMRYAGPKSWVFPKTHHAPHTDHKPHTCIVTVSAKGGPKPNVRSPIKHSGSTPQGADHRGLAHKRSRYPLLLQ